MEEIQQENFDDHQIVNQEDFDESNAILDPLNPILQETTKQIDKPNQNLILEAYPSGPEEFDITGSLVGKKAPTWEELFELYKAHGNALGFSVKKGGGRDSKKNGKTLDRYFYCSCEGASRAKKDIEINVPHPVQDGETVFPSPIAQPIEEGSPKKTKKRRQIYIKRTNCLAKMRVKLIHEEDLYIVDTHHVEHNHEMTRQELNHLKRSERSISGEKAIMIEEFEKAGVRPVDGYQALSLAAGGQNNVGHTLRDHLNFTNNLRMKKIEGGDCQNVVDRLSDLDEEDKGFYYKIKFGEDGTLKAVFWRDAMMRDDFDLFGDVVIFDTTYTTNKYNLICAPIVAINHNWQTVMLGCAFIADESTETFVWLLNTFKKSMGGKEPKTIFTDQDQAMAAAIERVFGGRTRHRLCLWHIQQNAVSRFGNLKTDEDFKKAFDHCLMGCVDEDEFEMCWRDMLEKYDLTENQWFHRLYEIREKWCTSLSKDFFSAGILSSQRSESTNHAICFRASRTTSLTRFFDIFNATINRWRTNEEQKEFDASNSTTRTVLHGSLVKHAAEVYTADIFKFFENEVKASFATTCRVGFKIDDNNLLYEICHEERRKDKYETVRFTRDKDDVTVECTCKHFNEVGWLCFHCIKALNMSNEKRIPEKYILKRWTKGVKKEAWDREYQVRANNTNGAKETPWRHHMQRKYYDLLSVCHENRDARRILEDGYNRDSLQIQQLLTTTDQAPSTSEVSSTATTTKSAPLVRDPPRVVTKGRQKKKPLSKFERKKPITDEYGSKTPNLHLI